MYFGVAMNDDQRQPEAKDKLKEAFAAAKVPALVEVYPARHGWCVADMPNEAGAPIYSAPDAERAWAGCSSSTRAPRPRRRASSPQGFSPTPGSRAAVPFGRAPRATLHPVERRSDGLDSRSDAFGCVACCTAIVALSARRRATRAGSGRRSTSGPWRPPGAGLRAAAADPVPARERPDARAAQGGDAPGRARKGRWQPAGEGGGIRATPSRHRGPLPTAPPSTPSPVAPDRGRRRRRRRRPVVAAAVSPPSEEEQAQEDAPPAASAPV
jgi:hypothetical protein